MSHELLGCGSDIQQLLPGLMGGWQQSVQPRRLGAAVVCGLCAIWVAECVFPLELSSICKVCLLCAVLLGPFKGGGSWCALGGNWHDGHLHTAATAQWATLPVRGAALLPRKRCLIGPGWLFWNFDSCMCLSCCGLAWRLAAARRTALARGHVCQRP